ncbi:MAG: dephospho-CoA kinase [Ruminococcus sp.]|nr:dephospho-CoA kinase [Ruminococcus sp.]
MTALNDVLVVGITGQTGAGKSAVSKVFADNGFAVIDADHISRIVVEKGTECLDEITDMFGKGILNPDMTLNRRALGDIVFADKTKLETLDSIIYPYITSEILHRIKEYSDNRNMMILLDAPTLFESHSDDFCEIIISVIADDQIRAERIISRDNLTPQQAKNRMDSQHSAEFFLSRSDYIIENNDSIENLCAVSEEVVDKIKYYYHNIRSSAQYL